MTPWEPPAGRAERRARLRRRRSERWEVRLRPFLYAFLIDTALIAAFLVAQRRTTLGLGVLSRRLRGEPDAKFPVPRFLGTGNIKDFEQLAGELEEMRRTTTTDVVTGLPNSAMTRSNLLLYTELAAREGAWLSACVADLDHFKEINDTHTHVAGDEVLRQLGQRIGGLMDAGQPLGRWGGDEFLLLFPRMDLPAATVLAEEVRRAVDEAPFQVSEGTFLQLTVTIGVAAGHGKGLDAMALFRAADEDLLATKAGGRNRVGSGRLL